MTDWQPTFIVFFFIIMAMRSEFHGSQCKIYHRYNKWSYYFLVVILLCHWSKHGHVTFIVFFFIIMAMRSEFHGSQCKIYHRYNKWSYYFLVVILLCHWSKHGHVTKIFWNIVIWKSVFHGVLTARSIHFVMTLCSFSIHSPQAPLSFSISEKIVSQLIESPRTSSYMKTYLGFKFLIGLLPYLPCRLTQMRG